MKRLRGILCWLLLLACFAACRFLGPAPDSSRLAAQVYDGFSGVLRVWVCSGWKPANGSFTAWLNDCASAFEKRRAGVFMQIRPVTEEALRSFSAERPGAPDMLLFSPGMLKSADGLLPLGAPEGLREDLRAAGLFAGELRALPVALGGYALCLNRELLPALPDDFSKLAPIKPLRGRERHCLWLPYDESRHAWSVALAALLPDSPLPEARGSAPAAYAAFTKGLVGGMPVTQREIRRLERLESGGAPDWYLADARCAFTDQLLLAGVAAASPERAALCEDFLYYMLSEACQKRLDSAGAFRVDGGEPLYAGRYGLGALELSLAAPLRCPPAFGAGD